MWQKIAFLLLFPLIAVGCQKNGDKKTEEQNDDKTSRQDKVELKVVSHDEFLKQVTKKLNGKVVVVDFWATWCGPCKKKFPKVVEMYDQYRDKGLVCVSASVDDVEQEADALAFLKEKKAVFPNYLIEGATGEVVQKHWKFSGVPAYFVLDRNGKIIARDPADRQDTKVDFDMIKKAALAELKK